MVEDGEGGRRRQCVARLSLPTLMMDVIATHRNRLWLSSGWESRARAMHQIHCPVVVRRAVLALSPLSSDEEGKSTNGPGTYYDLTTCKLT